MSEPRDGGPAYPSGEKYETRDVCGGVSQHSKAPYYRGMSLRDYFAGLAMQGLLARIPWGEGYSEELLAKAAYETADAMLAKRLVASEVRT